MTYLKYLEFLLSFSLLITKTFNIKHILNLENYRLSVFRFKDFTGFLILIERVLLSILFILKLYEHSLLSMVFLMIIFYKIKFVHNVDSENIKMNIFYKKFEITIFCLFYLTYAYSIFFILILSKHTK
jgi:hypothetical protein